MTAKAPCLPSHSLLLVISRCHLGGLLFQVQLGVAHSLADVSRPRQLNLGLVEEEHCCYSVAVNTHKHVLCIIRALAFSPIALQQHIPESSTKADLVSTDSHPHQKTQHLDSHSTRPSDTLPAQLWSSAAPVSQ